MSLLQVRLHQIQLFTEQRGKDISRPCLFNAVCQASVQDFKSHKLQNLSHSNRMKAEPTQAVGYLPQGMGNGTSKEKSEGCEWCHW